MYEHNQTHLDIKRTLHVELLLAAVLLQPVFASIAIYAQSVTSQCMHHVQTLFA